jgi:hypothetical protein
MTGSFWPKVVVAICPLNRLEAPLHWRIMEPRPPRDPFGSVESLSKLRLYR